MPCRRRNDLISTCKKNGISGDNDRLDFLANKGRKGRIKLVSVSIDYNKRLPEYARRSPRFRRMCFGIWIGGVHQQANYSSCWNQYAKKLQLLCHCEVYQKADARNVTARPVQTG